jgi:hypothetical protein
MWWTGPSARAKRRFCFFSPPLLFAPSSPFFSAKKQKTEFGIFFFVQAVFLGFEGVFYFYFSLIDLLIISLNLKQVEGVCDRSVSVGISF